MIEKIKAGIVGNGFVGYASQCFSTNNVEFIVYDSISEKCNPPNTKFEDLKFKEDIETQIKELGLFCKYKLNS